MNAKTFLDQSAQDEIICAIKDAEMMTSGEIRIHIENHCEEPVLDQAAHIFAKLDMQETNLRNGVLFYIAVKDRQFAILGDIGINICVDTCFWDDIKEYMLGHFQQGEFVKGLTAGIRMVGEKLQENFPYQADDVNELPDDISFGDN